MLQQLVLQFRGESLSKSLQLDALEEQIRAVLRGAESFDGIDSRPASVNIFLYTESPADTFQRVRPIFEKAERELGFTAAYRSVADNRFQVLWPENAPDFELRTRPAARS